MDNVGSVLKTEAHFHRFDTDALIFRYLCGILISSATADMRACLIFICLLAATFGSSVKGKAHVKHHTLRKASHRDKDKDAMTEEMNKAQILPALVTYEANSQEQEDEGMRSQENTNKEDGSSKITKSKPKSSAVLMSEEEMEALVKKDTDDTEELQETDTDDTKMLVKGEEEIVEDAEVKETVEKTEIKETELRSQAEQEAFFEETDGSTESEIPVDRDYAGDSGILQPEKILPAQVSDEGTHEKTLPIVDEQDVQNTEATTHSEDVKLLDVNVDIKHQAESVEINSDKTELKNVDILSQDSAADAVKDIRVEGEDEGKSNNDISIQSKKKPRKQKKNQRARKHSPEKDETQTGTELSQQDPPESEGNSTDSAVHKTKRRRAGKWGLLVGVNPVQIRATVDLYPSSRAALSGVTHDLKAPADSCDNFRCKRGKTCKLDVDNKPSCVCQVASECPPSVSGLDHVCGTDNKTYATSCELFATKCNLEGTKEGHRLHLDYTGSCKLIPQCQETELVQFPLRMRDWLKNVLLQLYVHDTNSPGFLTPKQHFRVKKLFESEKRLHAGDHTVELLAQDFEKNYNMYIYPVHWQFAQLDQHPSDRQLSHSELAPLRVPLVPMEHCTSLFFQECDADKDKQVSLKEWTSCFGIREEDMDTSLLF